MIKATFLAVSMMGATIGAIAAPSSDGEVKTITMLDGEHWWGLSDAFGRQMPFSGRTALTIDLRTQNYGNQTQSLLVSDRGRAIWCPAPVLAEFTNGTIRLTAERGVVTLVERAGDDLRGAFRYAASAWFKPTGEVPELLYFAAPQYNTWIELTYHQNERDILAYAQSMLDNGLPPGVFMIDDTWQFGYGTWEFDPRRFDNPRRMVDNLHSMGFKVLLWMCPWVSMDSPEYRRLQYGINPDDVKGWPTKGGFLASSRKPAAFGVPPAASVGWWNGVSALLDFTHPNAVAWFSEQLDRLQRDYGVDGFKFDGGGVHYYCGNRNAGRFAHDPDATPTRQSALYGEFALKYKGSEYRNGFGFAGKPVVMRLWDKDHSWDALNLLVPDMLAAGFVGCPFICPDMVGGGQWTAFLPGSAFEPELFIRSAQVQALCPMMQISASPWRVLDARHQAIFKAAVALRQRFAPRFVELARESARTGEPMLRHLAYSFPGCGYEETRDQFMMGESLMVAPVLEKGARTRVVKIPPGQWRADDGQLVNGPCVIEVAAPLERLPYFERICK